MPTPWLTPTEIAELTGLIRPSAQVRALRAMGLTVLTRPDGTPIVSLDNFRRVTGGADLTTPTDDDAEARQYRVVGGGGNVVALRR